MILSGRAEVLHAILRIVNIPYLITCILFRCPGLVESDLLVEETSGKPETIFPYLQDIVLSSQENVHRSRRCNSTLIYIRVSFLVLGFRTHSTLPKGIAIAQERELD